MLKFFSFYKRKEYKTIDLTVEEKMKAIKKIDQWISIIEKQSGLGLVYGDSQKIIGDLRYLREKLVMNSLVDEDLPILNHYLSQ